MRARRAVGAIALVALVAAAAHGDDAAEARVHFKKGAEAYETGEFRRAIEEFKASYARYPSPMLLYNLAQSYRKAGDNELALHEYKQYLVKTLDGTAEGRFRADAREQQERLERIIAEQSASARPPEPVRPAPIVETPANPLPQPAAPVVRSAAVTASQPVAPARKPIYKQWWLWTTIGVVAVAVGVGLGVGLSQSSTTYPTANLPQGTFRW
ncbi:MAG TPA: hypothetical protein VFF06_33270 [Polyangia bacterium]|nr:hypothetical protein [Polyangia bacterium]